MVNDVLWDMSFCVPALRQHPDLFKGTHGALQHIQVVLQQLLDNDLFVKAEKCGFHSLSVSFLVFIIALGSIQKDPAKVSAVVCWPRPKSQK